MRLRFTLAAAAALVFGFGCWLFRGRPTAAAPAASAGPVRQSLELTVYSEDFGMVREVRQQQLGKGHNVLRLLDVSRQLDPQSVLLRWEGAGPNPPELVGHAYDLGVANGDNLLKRYLGREVEVVRYGQNGQESERQQGTLMVEDNGAVVLQSDGRFFVHPPGTVVAPASGEITTIPQLSIQAESAAVQEANLELAYLTRGLSWSADYVATAAPEGGRLTLECWATVTNRTGADYPSARVSLVAGTPNRAVVSGEERVQMADYEGKPRAMGGFPGMSGGMAGGMQNQMSRNAVMVAPAQTVGDFHVYPLKNPTTVVQEQMNRLLMLGSEKVAVRTDYSARPPEMYSGGDGSTGQATRGEVAVAMEFANSEKNGLGMPLPHGALRLYEPDRGGSLRYAGAAMIPDTPKDQPVRVTLARAFDLFTDWHIVKSRKLNRHTQQQQIEVVLHNEKSAPVAVRVVQNFGGRWQIGRESHPHQKLDAYDAQWRVPVPAGGRTKLTYVVNLSA